MCVVLFCFFLFFFFFFFRGPIFSRDLILLACVCARVCWGLPRHSLSVATCRWAFDCVVVVVVVVVDIVVVVVVWSVCGQRLNDECFNDGSRPARAREGS